MDLHNKPFAERLRLLEKIDFPKATVGPWIRPIEHHLAKSLDDLKRLVGEDAYRNGSEGVVIKPSDGTYDLDGVPTKAGWLKWHKNAAFRVVVIERTETATPGVFNYLFGIPAGDLKPKKSAELDGKIYLVIGRSFSTTEKFEPGSEISIEAESVNLTEDKETGEVDLSFWVPNFIKEANRA